MADRITVAENSHLRRFWFPLPGHSGIGVTAFSRAEAEALAQSAALEMGWPYSSGAVVEDIDIRDLDPKHVLPNIGPVNFHGVWFPALNHNGAK